MSKTKLSLPSMVFSKPAGMWSRLLVTMLILLQAGTAFASVLGFVEFEGSRDDSTSPGYFTQDVVTSPDGRFVYAISSVNARLNAYTRDDESGRLALIQSVDNSGDYGLRLAQGMAISPDGAHVYVSGVSETPFGDGIAWFQRDAETGMLSYSGKIVQGEAIPVGYVDPNGRIRISPDGFYLYAADNASSGQIVIFKRANNGALSWVDTVNPVETSMSGPRGFAISPAGDNLYLLSATAKNLVVFSRDPVSGKLAFMQVIEDIHVNASDGIAGLEVVEDIIVSADGRFVYATGMLENNPVTSGDDEYAVLVFARNTEDGSLGFVESVTNTVVRGGTPEWDTLWWPMSLVLSTDAEQKFLYVGAQVADSINVFRRDANNGRLRWLGWETEGQNGVTNLDSVQKITLSPDGRHLYAALEQGDGIAVFDTRADLAVVKTDSMDPVSPGGRYSYTLSVTNNGPSDAGNVILTDTLPDGVGFISATPNAPGTSCSETAGTVVCNLADIAVTAMVSTIIEVEAPATAGLVTNTAHVVADQRDTVADNDSDSETTCVDTDAGTVCAGGEGTLPPSTEPPASGGGGQDPLGLLMLALLSVLARAGRRWGMA